MKVIGLTGGIGSGKSTVAGFLAELGAAVIDTDKVGHNLLKNDSQVRQQLIDAFGKRILTPEGVIDRRKLGSIVFRNSEALSRLNRIMHPRISEAVKAQLELYREQGVGVVVIEAPLLIEAEQVSLVDRVWVTTAPHAVIFKRLERVGLSHDEAVARIRCQLSDEERAKHANVVIETDCNLDELKEKVAELWAKFVSSENV